MSPPWMPFYVADYLGDTGHLSTIEHGAYLLLIMHYWQTGALPDDERKLARIARMTGEQWDDVRDTMSDMFGPGWTHKRIDAELAHADQVISKRSAAAKAMHAKRNAHAQQEQCTSDANAHAHAEQVHMQSTIPSQPQPPSPISDADASDASASAAQVDDGWPKDFREQFWAVYPHRVGKAKVFPLLDRIRKSRRVTFAKLMSGLDAYKASKPPDRQWCNPETWLNQGRWDDEPSTAAPSRGFGPQRGQHELSIAFDKLRDHAQRLEDAGGPEGRWSA